jgi:hypothetical protein
LVFHSLYYNAAMMWWPLLFILSVIQADDLVVEKYCFHTVPNAERAHAYFKSIAVPSDKVVKDNSCLIIGIKPHRRELVQKLLLSAYPHLSITFSSQELSKDPCELKVEKSRLLKDQNEGINIGKIPQVQTDEKNKFNVETMHITTLKDFKLTVDQSTITGECRYVNPQSYEVTLSVRKDAKPNLVITTPPADQESSILKTQIQLQRGSKIEIGSIVQELKAKSRNIDNSPRAESKVNERYLQEKIFLSIH